MKLRKLFAVMLTLLLVFGLLAGCSTKSSAPMESPLYNGSSAEKDSAANVESSNSLTDSAQGTSQAGAPQNQKLIKTVNIDAETEELDTLLANIDARIAELNGYVEARKIYNGSANSSRSRYADLTIRIPAESLDQFVDHVSETANVVSSNEDTQDVTLNYVATESRINALRTEEKRLLELLAKAQTMDDLLLIEARLSEVRADLEKHTSQLRLYDNLVNYGTIHLNLQEVKRYTVVEEPETVWERISTGFMESLKDLGDFGVELFVFLIVALPYLVIIAVIVIVVILLIKRRKHKKNKKNEKFPWENETPQDQNPQ